MRRANSCVTTGKTKKMLKISQNLGRFANQFRNTNNYHYLTSSILSSSRCGPVIDTTRATQASGNDSCGCAIRINQRVGLCQLGRSNNEQQNVGDAPLKSSCLWVVDKATPWFKEQREQWQSNSQLPTLSERCKLLGISCTTEAAEAQMKALRGPILEAQQQRLDPNRFKHISPEFLALLREHDNLCLQQNPFYGLPQDESKQKRAASPTSVVSKSSRQVKTEDPTPCKKRRQCQCQLSSYMAAKKSRKREPCNYDISQPKEQINDHHTPAFKRASKAKSLIKSYFADSPNEKRQSRKERYAEERAWRAVNKPSGVFRHSFHYLARRYKSSTHSDRETSDRSRSRGRESEIKEIGFHRHPMDHLSTLHHCDHTTPYFNRRHPSCDRGRSRSSLRSPTHNLGFHRRTFMHCVADSKNSVMVQSGGVNRTWNYAADSKHMYGSLARGFYRHTYDSSSPLRKSRSRSEPMPPPHRPYQSPYRDPAKIRCQSQGSSSSFGSKRKTQPMSEEEKLKRCNRCVRELYMKPRDVEMRRSRSRCGAENGGNDDCCKRCKCRDEEAKERKKNKKQKEECQERNGKKQRGNRTKHCTCEEPPKERSSSWCFRRDSSAKKPEQQVKFNNRFSEPYYEPRIHAYVANDQPSTSGRRRNDCKKSKKDAATKEKEKDKDKDKERDRNRNKDQRRDGFSDAADRQSRERQRDDSYNDDSDPTSDRNRSRSHHSNSNYNDNYKNNHKNICSSNNNYDNNYNDNYNDDRGKRNNSRQSRRDDTYNDRDRDRDRNRDRDRDKYQKERSGGKTKSAAGAAAAGGGGGLFKRKKKKPVDCSDCEMQTDEDKCYPPLKMSKAQKQRMLEQALNRFVPEPEEDSSKGNDGTDTDPKSQRGAKGKNGKNGQNGNAWDGEDTLDDANGSRTANGKKRSRMDDGKCHCKRPVTPTGINGEKWPSRTSSYAPLLPLDARRCGGICVRDPAEPPPKPKPEPKRKDSWECSSSSDSNDFSDDPSSYRSRRLMMKRKAREEEEKEKSKRRRKKPLLVGVEPEHHFCYKDSSDWTDASKQYPARLRDLGMEQRCQQITYSKHRCTTQSMLGQKVDKDEWKKRQKRHNLCHDDALDWAQANANYPLTYQRARCSARADAAMLCRHRKYTEKILAEGYTPHSRAKDARLERINRQLEDSGKLVCNRKEKAPPPRPDFYAPKIDYSKEWEALDKHEQCLPRMRRLQLFKDLYKDKKSCKKAEPKEATRKEYIQERCRRPYDPGDDYERRRLEKAEDRRCKCEKEANYFMETDEEHYRVMDEKERKRKQREERKACPRWKGQKPSVTIVCTPDPPPQYKYRPKPPPKPPKKYNYDDIDDDEYRTLKRSRGPRKWFDEADSPTVERCVNERAEMRCVHRQPQPPAPCDPRPEYILGRSNYDRRK